ncbi:sigma-70 family RNA polymerase sigma factor [Lysinibacillus sp. LZ02]|uniref:sigma-70 family RNA polymerase sigma factor n=1 Tax=Lysinibacillus sp. LZ02 TaxID=3420668 RepID=UPI003D35E62F
MEFEKLVTEMEPVIEKLLSKCRIYKNRDEYKQIAFIALWQAWETYDSNKYDLKAYVYNQMWYDVIDALRKNAKKESRFIATTDEKMTFYVEQKQQAISENSLFEKVAGQLKEEEKKLLHDVFIKDKSNEQLAKEYGISVEGIRKRKHRLRQKLMHTFQGKVAELKCHD